MAEEPKLSGFWSTVFPVHRTELNKFAPLSFMFFLVMLSVMLVKNAEDTIVVSELGAESLSFLKLFGTMPVLIFFMRGYAKLSTRINREVLFYTTLAPFVSLFLLFAFLIYPNADFLHGSKEAIDALVNEHKEFTTPILVYKKWTFSLFFILTEIWMTVTISLIFWKFANEIVSVSESKRFYALFGIIGSLGVAASGVVIKMVPSDNWAVMLEYIVLVVAVVAIMLVALYRWTCVNILNSEEIEAAENARKSRPDLKISESVRLIYRSNILRYIAYIVLAQGLTVTLFEMVWKEQLSIEFPVKKDYSHYMATFSIMSGIFTVFFGILAQNILRRYGWRVGALILPGSLLIVGFFFFGFIMTDSNFETFIANALSMGTGMVIVWIGFFERLFAKSAKNSLYDPTIQMAYIPLGEQEKLKGKTAVDAVGGRIGKSGASLIIQILLPLGGGSLYAISPMLGWVFFVVVALWIYAVGRLSKELQGKL